MRVYESNLPSRLKETALAFAQFGQDDGSKIYPSTGRVAWMRSLKTERSVREDISALVAMGVLVPVGPRHGGRGRTTRYQLDVAALPPRAPWKPGTPDPGFDPSNPELQIRVLPSKPGTPAHETRNSATETRNSETVNPDPQIPRSVSDLLERKKVERATAAASTEAADALNDDDAPQAATMTRARDIATALLGRHHFANRELLCDAVRRELGTDGDDDGALQLGVHFAWKRARTPSARSGRHGLGTLSPMIEDLASAQTPAEMDGVLKRIKAKA